jgi:phi LC3 family holin
MKINWKVRAKNPVFWFNVVIAILMPILAYMGISWQDVTSWAALGDILFGAIKNPVIVAAVIVSVANVLNDPTTKGLGDSVRALGYSEPNK